MSVMDRRPSTGGLALDILYIVHCAVSHFRLLFCEFLRYSLFQILMRRPLMDLPIQWLEQ